MRPRRASTVDAFGRVGRRIVIAILITLAVSGCASTGTREAAADAAAIAGKQPGEPSLGALVGDARIGSTVTLPAGNSLGATRAVVVAQYAAASGRSCRRIRLSEGGWRERLVCEHSAQGGARRWALEPALEGALEVLMMDDRAGG